MIYGAILGDIIGSRFEFDRGGWSKDFDLFTSESEFTDDTVMTLAIANAFLLMDRNADEQEIKDTVTECMQIWGRKYPHAGYGANFTHWIWAKNPQPYNSYGNGSAMRTSIIGWLFDDLERTREVAKWVAEVSHNHPEGIKGAECTASVIWMIRNGFTRDQIATYAIEEFGYDLSKTVDEWRPLHRHDESCMDSMPKALVSFLESTDFEDAIRNAVSLGGDTDTIAAITGSMAEAFHGVPAELKQKCEEMLPKDIFDMLQIIESVLIGK